MIELTYDEEFAVLTIRRPQALNALSFELIGQIGYPNGSSFDHGVQHCSFTRDGEPSRTAH